MVTQNKVSVYFNYQPPVLFTTVKPFVISAGKDSRRK